MQITPKSGLGRPLSEEQLKARSGIIRAFQERGSWSTEELADKCDLKSDEVLRAMRFFQREGYVKRDGTKRTPGRAGHPPIKWTRIE